MELAVVMYRPVNVIVWLFQFLFQVFFLYFFSFWEIIPFFFSFSCIACINNKPRYIKLLNFVYTRRHSSRMCTVPCSGRHWGRGVCPGGVCPGGVYLPRGVSACQGVSAQRGVCWPGGVCLPRRGCLPAGGSGCQIPPCE